MRGVGLERTNMTGNQKRFWEGQKWSNGCEMNDNIDISIMSYNITWHEII